MYSGNYNDSNDLWIVFMHFFLKKKKKKKNQKNVICHLMCKNLLISLIFFNLSVLIDG